jgi:hypothetical protein
MGGSRKGKAQLAANPFGTLRILQSLMPLNHQTGDQPRKRREQGTGEENAVGTPAQGSPRSHAS